MYLVDRFVFIKEKKRPTATIYGIWQKVLNMRIIAINKISYNLKIKCSKIPSAVYSNRWDTYRKSHENT